VILATSREALGLTAEANVPVPSLDTSAGPASDAVTLFADRAQQVDPSFTVTADVVGVVQLCAHLDGLPLAIELAATRVRAMSPTQILDHLDGHYRLLQRTARDGI